MASKISFRIKEGEIWNILMVKNMIPDLKERLGVQINVSDDQLITVAGSMGGVEMCKCILQRNERKPTVTNETAPGLNENCMAGPDFIATASNLAMKCNVPKCDSLGN